MQQVNNQPQLKMLSIKFSQIDKQEQQFAQHYEFDLQPEVLESIEVIKNIPTIPKAKVISKLLKTRLGKPLEIPGGWNSKRQGFSAIVEHSYYHGIRTFVMNGFVSTIDDERWLIFDNILTYVKREMMTPSGPISEMCLIGATSIHINNLQPPQAKRVMGRPSDLARDIQTTYIENSFEESLMKCYQDWEVEISDMALNSSTVYLRKIIESYETCEALMSFGYGEVDLHARMYGILYDGNTRENPVLRAIEMKNGGFSGRVKYDDIIEQFFNDVVVIESDFKLNQNTGSFVSLYSKEVLPFAEIARYVCNALPVYMAAASLAEVNFSVNQSSVYWGNFSMDIGNYVSYFESVSQQTLAVFKTKFIEEVFMGIPYIDELGINIAVRAHAYGETEIKVSSAVAKGCIFIYPSFASSIISPNVQESEGDLRKMSGELEVLLQHLRM